MGVERALPRIMAASLPTQSMIDGSEFATKRSFNIDNKEVLVKKLDGTAVFGVGIPLFYALVPNHLRRH